MTSVYDDQGRNVACTVIQAGPCAVTQIKRPETDGYSAVQMGFEDAKEKNTTKALKGHFAKANVTPKKKLVEFRDCEIDKKVGERVTVADVFSDGDIVNVIGTSKGKGFQGVVRRHGFGGVGDQTHGQHNRNRAPGSIGAASTPSKVIKGLKMAGQMGNRRVKMQNLTVLKVLPEKNLLLIKGAVPGHKGAYVIIEK